MSETATVSLRDKAQMQIDSTCKSKPGVTAMSIERRPQPITEVTEETMDATEESTTASGAELAESVIAELDNVSTVEANEAPVTEAEEVEEPQQEATSITEYLNAGTSVNTIRPRLLVTFSITDPGLCDYLSVLRKPLANYATENGALNLFNPLAKPNEAKGIGAGALRKALPSLLDSLDLLARQPIVVMGDAEEVVHQVTDNIWNRVSSAVADSFSPSEQGEYVIDTEDSQLALNINDLVAVNSWAIASTEGENASTEVVSHISLNAPILYNGDNTNKFLYDYVKTMAAIVRTIASSHASNTDVTFGVVLSNNMLVSPSVRTLFNDMMEVTDDNEQPVYEFITMDDLADNSMESETINALFGSADRDIGTVFAHGGSMMFVTNL